MPPFLRPTKLPEWASGDTADVVEPTAGEKSLGWVAGQTPPAPYMNWLMGGDFGYFPWLQYVSTFEQQALTWPERQTFQKGFAASGVRSTITGLDVTGLAADVFAPAAGTGVLAKPFLDLPLPAPRFQTARHIVNASPLRYGRAYSTPTGFEFSLNAGWNDATSLWVADDTASPAILFRLTGSTLRICRVDTPSTPFADAAFTERVNVAGDGALGHVLGFTSATHAEFSAFVREAVHYVGAAGEPAFQNGFTNAAGYQSCYVRDASGIVTLMVSFSPNSSSPASTTAFTLPVGWRPVQPTTIAAANLAASVTSWISVQPTGTVTVLGSQSITSIGGYIYCGSFIASPT